METPIHQESQLIGKWFVLLIVSFFVAAVVVAFLTTSEEEAGMGLFGLLLLLVFLAFCFRMKVVVTASELRFGFMFWRKRLPLANVEVLAIEYVPLMAGFGIHYHRGKWVYNAHFKGQGVHLVYQGRKHYLIGSDNPEALLNALKTAMATR